MASTIRGPCKNRVNKFCFVCGDYIIGKNARQLTDITKAAYRQYFGISTGAEKWYIPTVICLNCRLTLINWSTGTHEFFLVQYPYAMEGTNQSWFGLLFLFNRCKWNKYKEQENVELSKSCISYKNDHWFKAKVTSSWHVEFQWKNIIIFKFNQWEWVSFWKSTTFDQTNRIERLSARFKVIENGCWVFGIAPPWLEFTRTKHKSHFWSRKK